MSSEEASDPKQSFETLRESQEKLAAAFRFSPSAMSIIRLEDGCILIVNDSFLKLSGYDRDEVLGRSTLELELWERSQDREAFLGVLRSETSVRDQEMRYRRKSGEVGIALLSAEVIEVSGEPCLLAVATDITKRKQAEQELRRFRQAMDQARESIFVIDAENARFIDANAKACQQLGYSREELLALRVWDVEVGFPLRGHKEWQAHVDEVTAMRSPSLLPGTHRRKDGSTFPVEASITHESLEGKDYLLVWTRDVTERQQAEEALRKSEARYRSLFEDSRDGVYRSTPSGRFLDVNPAIVRMFGFSSKEELMAVDVRDLYVDPSDRERFVSELADRGFVKDLELKAKRADGRELTILETSTAVRDERGEIVAFQGILRDISERKRAEQALKKSEERYRSLFEDSRDVIYISTPEGRLVDINEAGVALLGFESKADLLQVDIPRDLYLDPREREHSLELLEQKGFVKDLEVRLKAKDGRVLTVLETSTAVREDSGAITAYQGILRDVTEQRELEKQLQHSQKMEVLGRMAGGVAHDFNNLLTVINGYSALALERVEPDAALRPELEKILAAGEKAADLTRQFLAISRRQVMSPRLVDLNEVVIDLEEILRRTLGEDIELATVLTAEPGSVRADPAQLEQVILNLALNARDAMPAGGRLLMKTSTVELGADYSRRHPGVEPRTYVELVIQDTGVGMEEELVAHIFEPFFTTKEPGKGTGLGLSIAYGIVEQSGGHIEVESSPGKGSRFKVLLPLVFEEQVVPYRDGVMEVPHIGRGTILLVEDDREVRRLAGQVLRSAGYDVLEAETARRAVDFCRDCQCQVDLLVTDVVMPELSGPELAREIRSCCPEIKVLFISGYSDPHLLPRETSPSTAVLQKPFSPRTLVRRVSEALAAGPELRG